MKYDCADEFDMSEIFAKLTSASKPMQVAAKDFFVREEFTLQDLRKALQRVTANK